jgi:hypothetical protein
MDFLLLFLGFVIGWIVGVNLLTYRIKQAIIQLDKADMTAEIEKMIKEIPVMKTEKVNGFIFLYDKVSSAFMCQGSSLDEVAANLKSVKNINFAQVTHDEQEFWFIDGKVTSNKELQ